MIAVTKVIGMQEDNFQNSVARTTVNYKNPQQD